MKHLTSGTIESQTGTIQKLLNKLSVATTLDNPITLNQDDYDFWDEFTYQNELDAYEILDDIVNELSGVVEQLGRYIRKRHIEQLKSEGNIS